ncbi:mucin-2 [Drosophila tropicalis]|uniref:mucin-2 n=1 Tax=Drosophila tropicalis TaxID=46794 RepID=UPI0035ABA40D
MPGQGLKLGLVLCLLMQIQALPTIQQKNRVNYVQQLDKSFFQPPEIEQTIDEVQKILANDPALPRLTRGEIEELYEKVTREEYEKSIEAGDMSRADSMRALMLVLPFNTDNNTEENLQELYTRQPVTRVIDGYTPPDPIKFLTPDPNAVPRSTVPGGNPAVKATTYKPAYAAAVAAAATTYHPPAPAPVMYQMAPSLGKPSMDFQPVTKLPQAYDYAKGPSQRFSSHYSAKNAQFLRKPKPQAIGQSPIQTTSTSSTVKPVADILESLGIVGGGVGGGKGNSNGNGNKRYALDDYYPAESAPQPVIAMADLRGLQGARIRPDAYSNFKPLNIGEELRVKPEVEGYLTRFGIVKKAPKALKKSKEANQEPTGEHTELSTATAKLPPQTNSELAKLLENLQELERLNTRATTKTPVKPVPTTTARTTTTTTSTTTTTTRAPPTSPQPTAQLITHGEPLLIEAKKPRRRIDPNIDINFANKGNQQTPNSPTDELSKLLENLQELEKLRINPENVLKKVGPSIATTRATTTTTTTTTAKPTVNQLNEARELELILRQLQQHSLASTTIRPVIPKNLDGRLGPARANTLGPGDLVQLQRLLSDDRELERLYEQARNSKKKPSTTSTTTTTTTTSTTTPRPTPKTTLPSLPSVDHAQFEALITRVQQLERLQHPAPTVPSFTTRNVVQSESITRANLPSNDYAHLQDLVYASELPNSGQVEISTAASTAKQRPLSHFERSNGLLQDVQPQDYVQLQKLLSKVQELERVQLQTAKPTTTATPSYHHHQLVTAASGRSQNVKTLNGAHIVYAETAPEPEPEPELKLDLPVYEKPQKKPSQEQSSSEELRELAMSQPANPASANQFDDAEFEQYQQFFSSLEDNHHMQPIYKTITSTTSTTTTTAKPTVKEVKRTTPPNITTKKDKTEDLAELQKLLYNTQQLQKLGVALPHELSQQLESQLQASTTTSTTRKTSTTTTTAAPDTSSPAVFSLTTLKPASPRPPRPTPTTEMSAELPIFSATKIIEAAIKRAANRIGVATEQPLGSLGAGFRRRSDDEEDLDAGGDDQEGVLNGDLMAEFSELNYQLAKPDPEPEKPQLGQDLGEIQRLISNLQELQKLNVSLDQVKPKNQATTDALYLQSLEKNASETFKNRRQSETTSTSTVAISTEKEDTFSTTSSPTRLSLDLGLMDDGDLAGDSPASSTTDSSSTPSPPSSSSTEESRNGSLDDLADSFGPDPITEEPLPPKKKNGFYFLADWNSFLEVGDGDDQVVVRLSPKIGDPRLFLPVKIPS